MVFVNCDNMYNLLSHILIPCQVPAPTPTPCLYTHTSSYIMKISGRIVDKLGDPIFICPLNIIINFTVQMDHPVSLLSELISRMHCLVNNDNSFILSLCYLMVSLNQLMSSQTTT